MRMRVPQFGKASAFQKLPKAPSAKELTEFKLPASLKRFMAVKAAAAASAKPPRPQQQQQSAQPQQQQQQQQHKASAIAALSGTPGDTPAHREAGQMQQQAKGHGKASSHTAQAGGGGQKRQQDEGVYKEGVFDNGPARKKLKDSKKQ
jgi:hypothetical protein